MFHAPSWDRGCLAWLREMPAAAFFHHWEYSVLLLRSAPGAVPASGVTKMHCLVVSYALSPSDIATCPRSHCMHSFSVLCVQILAVLLFLLNCDLKVVILSKMHTHTKLLNMHKIIKLLQIAGIVNELTKSWWRPIGGREYFLQGFNSKLLTEKLREIFWSKAATLWRTGQQ